MTSLQTKGLSKANNKTDRTPCTLFRSSASKPIQMEIVFGRPSKDCQDVGICRINLLDEVPSNSKQQHNCKTKTLAFVQQITNGNLVFRFPKKLMNHKSFETQFANNQFTVPETYLLPEPLQQLFCPRLLIEKGTYSIRDDGDNLFIEM